MPIRIRISMSMPIRIRISIKIMPIPMRILPKVSHLLENPNLFLLLVAAFAALRCFIFLISAKDVITFSILDSILKFCGKKFINFFIWLALIPIRTGMPIGQNDADPIRIRIHNTAGKCRRWMQALLPLTEKIVSLYYLCIRLHPWVKQSISDPLTCLIMVTCAEEEMGSLPEDTWQISWPVRCGSQRISALSQEYLHNTSIVYLLV